MTATRWWALLLCGILAVGPVSCEKRPEKSEDRQQAVSEFPSRIGPMSKWSSRDLEPQHPGLGSVVEYTSPGIVASVYLYNAQIATIPSGARSRVVREHFKNVLDDVYRTKEMGLVESVTKVSEETVFFDPAKKKQEALSASFQITDERGKHITRVYLTGYRNHFLKLRVTYGRPDQAKAETTLGDFLAELAALLKDSADDESTSD